VSQYRHDLLQGRHHNQHRALMKWSNQTVLEGFLYAANSLWGIILSSAGYKHGAPWRSTI
jgi:hypothetical protein